MIPIGTILKSKFNISFGDSHTDTCITCHKFLAKLKTLSYIILPIKKFTVWKISKSHYQLESTRIWSMIKMSAYGIKRKNGNFKRFHETIIENSRIKPPLFVVVNISKRMVFYWTKLLNNIYVQKFPFKIQPIKKFSSRLPTLNCWNGGQQIMDPCFTVL